MGRPRGDAQGLYGIRLDAAKNCSPARKQPTSRRKLILNTNRGRARAFGSPTFFVGNEMFFGKEQLREGRGTGLGQ